MTQISPCDAKKISESNGPRLSGGFTAVSPFHGQGMGKYGRSHRPIPEERTPLSAMLGCYPTGG